MSEFKPKKDDQRADEGSLNKGKTGDSPKAQGDKLQRAVDEASKPVQEKIVAEIGSPSPTCETSRDHGFGRDGAAVGDSPAGLPWRRFPTVEMVVPCNQLSNGH